MNKRQAKKCDRKHRQNGGAAAEQIDGLEMDVDRIVEAAEAGMRELVATDPLSHVPIAPSVIVLDGPCDQMPWLERSAPPAPHLVIVSADRPLPATNRAPAHPTGLPWHLQQEDPAVVQGKVQRNKEASWSDEDPDLPLNIRTFTAHGRAWPSPAPF